MVAVRRSDPETLRSSVSTRWQGDIRVPARALEENALTSFPVELLVRRLRMSSVLSDEDVRAIYRLPFSIKDFAARAPITRERDRPSHCCLIVSGLICRAKMTGEGARQLLSFHIPGDIPDLQSLHLAVMDHDLIAL